MIAYKVYCKQPKPEESYHPELGYELYEYMTGDRDEALDDTEAYQVEMIDDVGKKQMIFDETMV